MYKHIPCGWRAADAARRQNNTQQATPFGVHQLERRKKKTSKKLPAATQASHGKLNRQRKLIAPQQHPLQRRHQAIYGIFLSALRTQVGTLGTLANALAVVHTAHITSLQNTNDLFSQSNMPRTANISQTHLLKHNTRCH